MAYPIGQYVRNHTVTVAVANWGIAQTHAHSLNDGMRPTVGASTGYTPNLVHVDSAYVTVNGTNYAIDPQVVTVTAVSSTLVTFIVGPATTALRDSLIKLYGAIPTSLTFEMVTRWVHTAEMGATAVADEPLAAPLAAGTLPIGLADLSPGTSLETIYVRTAGSDTNDGRTAGTAFLTVQRALNDIMAESPLYHSILVDIGPGTFAGTWNMDGVELRNGAKVYIIGSAPARGGATDKTTTSAGAATWTATRDWMGGVTLRFTPDAAWDVAIAATDIGRIAQIDDGAGGHVTMVSIANVQVTGAPATDYIDLIPNQALVGALPAWMNNAGAVPLGVRVTILDVNAATTVTTVSGTVNLSNIKSASLTGGGAMLATTTTGTQNLIGAIRFTAVVTLVNVERFAFHGCRIENATNLTNCADCTSNTTAVPQAGASRYWPQAIWTRLGYSNSEAATAWGGMGFCLTGPITYTNCYGTIAGQITYGCKAAIIGGNMTFTGCSFGDTVTSQASQTFSNVSYVSITYSRLTAMAYSASGGSLWIRDYCTWAAAAGAVDDTMANAPVSTGGGLLEFQIGSSGGLVVAAAARVEGHNSNANALNKVITVGTGGQFVATGGHDANLYSDNGWLSMAGGSVGVMTGDRTFARKNCLASYPDVYLTNATLQTGASDTWTKNGSGAPPGGDNTVSQVIYLDNHSNFKLGTPVQGAPTGGLVCGAEAAGAGVNCGANGTVHIRNGSHATIADFYVNNDDGAAGAIPAVVVLHGSFLHFTGTAATSYLARCGTHDNVIQNGSILVAGGGAAFGGFLTLPAPEEAACRGIHSDYLAAIGTAQGTYIRHE